MKLTIPRRWALIPVAAMVGCSGSVVIADRVGRVAGRVVSPESFSRFDAVFPADVRAGIVYGIAAVLWVVAGAWVAPRHKGVVALVLFVAGAWLAWRVLAHWYFPELHPRAYQKSRVPLALTLVGGLIGVVVVMGQRWRPSMRLSPPMKP